VAEPDPGDVGVRSAGGAQVQEADGPSQAPLAGQSAPVGSEMPRLIESLLFVASAPVSMAQLSQALGVDEPGVQDALEELAASYTTQHRGLTIQRKGDRVQMVAVAEAGPHIERFLGLDLTTKLSQAAMEALALVAYRQPITRSQMEAVRGVNCDGVVRTLLARGLIEPVGRLEQAGRPFLYGTTFQFLQYFGLDGLEQLPPLPEE
jgi:segregation and condensation protein B